ncbi:MAG: TolC family protein [Rhodocyclales bacterium]|nr:TolC family protein [Rhodocyclales bacterium]
MPHRHPLYPFAIGIVVLLAGCSLAPPYQVPEIATPNAYREAIPPQAAGLPWKPAAGDAAPQAAWEVFDLPELSGLLARLEAANASLAVARARHVQAAALIDQAGAGRLPSISGNAANTRSRSGTAAPTTTESIGLAASWEVDLWGRVGDAVAADTASANASAADLAGVRLSLQAQLVQALLSLRIVEAQRRLLDATVADYERYVQLTAARVRFGVAGRSELAQAESQLHSAAAQAVETGVQRAQLEHAIAVMVGAAPANFNLPPRPDADLALRAPLRDAAAVEPGSGTTHAGIFSQVPALPAVPLAAPSTLLERRPDIAAAERRVAAANAQIGVAQAAFFPVLSLSGSAGRRGASWSELSTAPARLWSLGPALALSLFDGGLRSAQKAQAVGAWEQSAATYRQTVLTAFQEVEDQLATLRVLADEARIQDKAVQAARVGAELTLAQYRAGTIGSLQVIVTNSALLNAERASLDLHNRRLAAAVTLMRALGGGWQAANGKTPSDNSKG